MKNKKGATLKVISLIQISLMILAIISFIGTSTILYFKKR
jgi:hypothetical protein